MGEAMPTADPLEVLVQRVVELTLARLAPYLVAARSEWTTPKNAEELFGMKWRALDEWAQRHGAQRYAIGRSPRYRTADLDALLASTARAPKPANGNADDEEDALARVGARRVAR